MPHPPTVETDARALIHSALVGEALENGPVAVFVFDEEGRYLSVNGFACDLLGFEREQLLRRCVGELSALPEGLAIESYLHAVETGGEATTSVRHADGSVLKLRFRANATRLAGMPVFVGVAWPAPA
ncbi:MAG TPA: PAS domain S-box protein [Gaiellaceae bacterium]|nr:PAS domain S-box protein [Gaiellaceae bacterium]